MKNPKENVYSYSGAELPVSSADINRTGYMLMERIKFTGNTAIAVLSTANTNLDGTGTIVDIITGAGNGTLVKKVTIKAQGSTTQGMVRIFLKISSTYYLLREIEVPALTQDSKHQTYIGEIPEPYYLKSTYVLTASTEKGETFIVTAEGLDMAYPA